MKMVLTRGFPASGKSAYAAELVAASGGRVLEVSRDNVRAALGFPGFGDSAQETIVSEVCDAAVAAAARFGRDVVVSNTHLESHVLRAMIEHGVRCGFDEIEVVDLVVDHGELLRRDAARGHKVGEGIMRDMFSRHPESQWPDGAGMVADARARLASASGVAPVSGQDDPELPAAVVVDVDGTLARMQGRRPYDYDLVHTDVANVNVRDLVNLYAAAGRRIVVMTGREDDSREVTRRWLEAQGVRFDELHMRRAGDTRDDATVKRELIADHVEGRFRVETWLDDRDSIVAMVRAAFPDTPTICLQVAPGTF